MTATARSLLKVRQTACLTLDERNNLLGNDLAAELLDPPETWLIFVGQHPPDDIEQSADRNTKQNNPG